MKDKLRIAQLSPLAESVPPRYYGGTERVVSYLTEELVRQGHEVTLFASGDSHTRAKLVPGCEQALRLNGDGIYQWHYLTAMMEKILQRIDEFDVIHSHIDVLPFPWACRLPVPLVSTMHGRLDQKVIRDVFKDFPEVALVSISDYQRTPVRRANWTGTIYHGLPMDLYRFNPEPQGYLAFLGRISPEKGLDSAIRLAKEVGIPLKIAAKVDDADLDYFEREIKHLLDHPLVEYIGEISESEKSEFLGNALALIFMIDWPEPFGLVMIEAMACGTPVIARRRGSVPEVIDEAITGFVVETEQEAVQALSKIPDLPRSRCREVFEERFSVQRMTQDYVELFQKLIAHHQPA